MAYNRIQHFRLIQEIVDDSHYEIDHEPDQVVFTVWDRIIREQPLYSHFTGLKIEELLNLESATIRKIIKIVAFLFLSTNLPQEGIVEEIYSRIKVTYEEALIESTSTIRQLFQDYNESEMLVFTHNSELTGREVACLHAIHTIAKIPLLTQDPDQTFAFRNRDYIGTQIAIEAVFSHFQDDFVTPYVKDGLERWFSSRKKFHQEVIRLAHLQSEYSLLNTA